VIRPIYDWTMRQAERKNAVWVLAAISFIESSVFPIPPDILLIPIILADRRRAFVIAGICTVASVCGGWLGYAIGYYLFETLGRQILEFYHAMKHYDEFKAGFDQWGMWIIIVKGMTPIPYKLVTIASGFAGFNFPLFMVLSTVTRGLRYTLVSSLLYFFGAPVQAIIEKYMEIALIGFLVLVVLGFVSVRYIF